MIYKLKKRHYKVFCKYKSLKANVFVKFEELIECNFHCLFISQAVTGCYINALKGL